METTSKVLRRRDTGFLIVMVLIGLLGSAIGLYYHRQTQDPDILMSADVEEMRTPLPAEPRKYQ